MEKTKQEIIMWIAEYCYYKVNPRTKRDVPSVVYEQAEKDFNKFLNN